MQSAILFTKFSQGVNWNGIFYSLYKTSSTVLSFILFKYLTTAEFSAWANINSIIFLALLWIDFGLRKSIPRYCPEFAKDSTSHKRFIKYLLILQTLLLISTIPFLLYAMNGITTLLRLKEYQFLFTTGIFLFFMEGVTNVLRLIYHAHFWNKQFNLITTIALLGEIVINAAIIICASTSLDMLNGILVSKLCIGIAINAIAFIKLNSLYKDNNYPGNKSINFDTTIKEFAKHSGIMWINTNLKSLSERNVLMPVFTYTMGAPLANLFKIANDGALFFYRIVLKTIGTTDTALLSHIQSMNEEEKLMPIAFQKLVSKIASLCIPLLGILLVLFLHEQYLFLNPFVFQAFFIMAIGYLGECVLSPYERVLEIKQRYVLLMIAYIPYIIMLCTLLSFNIVSYIGLINSLLIIHGVRLVSSLIMTLLARRQYPLLLYPPISIHVYRGIGISILLYLLYLILSITKYHPLSLAFTRSLLG